MPTNALSKGHIQARQLGFTLIELVVGMLVIGIAIVMLTSMLFPQADRAASTLHRVRSAELAHSVMNEIWGKRYDQHTNANGGVPACGSSLGSNCSTSLGPEVGESRNHFNDVDDYHGLNETATMLNSSVLDSSQTYANAYPNYKLNVTVAYGAVPNTKLVTINVTTPGNEVITYNLVRSNY
ncbi:MAG: type IV pilus modification PilV family protein [Shewanella sp.]